MRAAGLRSYAAHQSLRRLEKVSSQIEIVGWRTEVPSLVQKRTKVFVSACTSPHRLFTTELQLCNNSRNANNL